jgi:hypothetical protein
LAVQERDQHEHSLLPTRSQWNDSENRGFCRESPGKPGLSLPSLPLVNHIFYAPIKTKTIDVKPKTGNN